LASQVDTVLFKRGRFGAHEQIATENVQHGEDKAEQRHARKRKQMPDKGDADETDFSPIKAFKTQMHLIVIDSLLVVLERRMRAYDGICRTFGFLS